MTNQTEIVLAYFDILGTSNRLNEGELQKVYEYYKDMAKLCADTTVPVIIENCLYEKSLPEKLVGKQRPYVRLQKELKNAYFSDTFIVWMEFDGFLNEILADFFEKCTIIFCEALKRGIPLRGTISRGTAIMDEQNKIFLGTPLVEAAKGETYQNWLGVGIGKSFSAIHTFDTRYVLPYCRHIKQIHNEQNRKLLIPYALDWPRSWREHQIGDIQTIISAMNTDETFSAYYESCLCFHEYSKNGDSIWEKETGIHGVTKQAVSDLIQPFLIMDV